MTSNTELLNIRYKLTDKIYEEYVIDDNMGLLTANIEQLQHMTKGNIYKLAKDKRVIYTPNRLEWFGYGHADFIGKLISIYHNLFYYKQHFFYAEIKFTFKVPGNNWETETYYYRAYNHILSDNSPDISIENYIYFFSEFKHNSYLSSG
jgi:hypothetical protein